jgi:hypothetical protein
LKPTSFVGKKRAQHKDEDQAPGPAASKKKKKDVRGLSNLNIPIWDTHVTACIVLFDQKTGQLPTHQPKVVGLPDVDEEDAEALGKEDEYVCARKCLRLVN